MPITALPPAPSRAEPATFSDKGDALLGALDQFVTEANALETNVNAKEVNTNADAIATAADVVTAAASEAAAAASANYKGPWADQTGAANVPYAVSHLGVYWQLTENLADVTAKTPGTDPEWIRLSSNYADLTAKTGDATLTASELLGNVVITNTGAGAAINLTLQPGTADYSITFEVTVAQYLRVTAAGTDKFRYYNLESAAGGYIRSNVIGSRWKITWSGGNWSVHGLIRELKYDE
jgi:hypothetical protein